MDAIPVYLTNSTCGDCHTLDLSGYTPDSLYDRLIRGGAGNHWPQGQWGESILEFDIGEFLVGQFALDPNQGWFAPYVEFHGAVDTTAGVWRHIGCTGTLPVPAWAVAFQRAYNALPSRYDREVLCRVVRATDVMHALDDAVRAHLPDWGMEEDA